MQNNSALQSSRDRFLNRASAAFALAPETTNPAIIAPFRATLIHFFLTTYLSEFRSFCRQHCIGMDADTVIRVLEDQL